MYAAGKGARACHRRALVRTLLGCFFGLGVAYRAFATSDRGAGNPASKGENGVVTGTATNAVANAVTNVASSRATSTATNADVATKAATGTAATSISISAATGTTTNIGNDGAVARAAARAAAHEAVGNGNNGGTQRRADAGDASSDPAFHTPRLRDPVTHRLLAIRGITVGPIESALHPGKGYGTAACARTMRELARMGATWVSLTPFGRIADLHPSGIDWTFEAPFADNRRAVMRAIAQAHAAGLRVMLVPHLWVETGAWRGDLAPGDDAAWQRWAASYRAFLLAWAEVAARAGVDMLSVGVELKSWVTSTRAPLFFPIIDAVRRVYRGPLTYSSNWDDAEDNVLWGALDVIGINAFYPLADRERAPFDRLLEGGRKVASQVHALAARWGRPVIFTEVGYTTRTDPALRPWEWPDRMSRVRVDERAQAEAYRALLSPLLDEPSFGGFFVWRVYADPDDASQEAEWGFSPRGKLSELVVRDAFAAHFRSDGPLLPGALPGSRATRPGSY